MSDGTVVGIMPFPYNGTTGTGYTGGDSIQQDLNVFYDVRIIRNENELTNASKD